MNGEVLRIIWHQRLGHRDRDMHRSMIGLPNFPIATAIDNSLFYLVYLRGYSVQLRYCYRRWLATAFVASAACMAKTAYVLLRYHFGKTLTVLLCAPRLFPLSGSTNGLPPRAPDLWSIPYVRMDLGGELGRCQEVLDLLTHTRYSVEPTAVNSSHQNGTVERPHRDIGNSNPCHVL